MVHFPDGIFYVPCANNRGSWVPPDGAPCEVRVGARTTCSRQKALNCATTVRGTIPEGVGVRESKGEEVKRGWKGCGRGGGRRGRRSGMFGAVRTLVQASFAARSSQPGLFRPRFDLSATPRMAPAAVKLTFFIKSVCGLRSMCP